jgi:hypothetical protein
MSTETLALIGLIVAAGALYYQAQSYKLSRRELSLKVTDLSTLVHRLEDEITERKRLDGRHTQLTVTDLTHQAEALNHASKLSAIHLETSFHESRHVSGAIADTQYVLLAQNAVAAIPLGTSQSAPAELLTAAANLCKARLAQIAVSDEWDRERHNMDAERAKIQAPDELAAAKEWVRIVTETGARLEGKYADRLRLLNEKLITARVRFLEVLALHIQIGHPDS